MATSSRLLAALLAASLAGSLLVACGSDTSEGDDVPASELTETTTPEALAAAVLEDLDVEPISLEAVEPEDDAPEGAVAVSMRLPLSYDDSGMLLRVGATSELAGDDAGCGEDEFEDGCTDDELPDGGRQLVSWQAEEPEEDPGIVQVLTERADPEATVVVYLAGPMIPEDLADETDLELFTLGDLKDLTLDPAIGPTTTPELIAAGEELPDEWWVEPGSEG